MHFSNNQILALAASVSLASAGHIDKRGWSSSPKQAASSGSGKTHMVSVGLDAKGNSAYEFWPNDITAAPGDQIQFNFWPESHSVVQGSFDNPCWPSSDNAFFSGYVPSSKGAADTTFTITVQDNNPVWFYCSRDTHCESGMVGVINAEKGGSTLQDYAKAAKNAKASKTPSNKWQPGAFQATLDKGSMSGMSGMGGMGGMNSSGSGAPGNAAGHVAASTSMVGAMAGFLAWALL